MAEYCPHLQRLGNIPLQRVVNVTDCGDNRETLISLRLRSLKRDWVLLNQTESLSSNLTDTFPLCQLID